ncbi:MAG: HNH endonuclease signature motif containing protein [Pseudomonadota bacterium]
MTRVNQTERAQLAWQALIEVARHRSTLTYGELGARISVHHRAIRYVLGPIQDYCLESRLPPLTILVVNGSGRPGTGFIAHDPEDLDGGLEAVWGFNWHAVQNPFDFAAEGLSYRGLIKTLTQNPDEAGTVYAKVKSRGVQQILFRDAVRKAYASRCAFSGTQFPDALDACHIIPWAYATPQQRMDVRNGLLLNPLHHRLFDKAYLTLTTDYRILYWDPKGAAREYSKMEAALTINLHNQPVAVPHLFRLRPLPEYIQRHNKLVDWQVE